MLKVNVYFGTIIYGKLNFILTDMQQDNMIYFITSKYNQVLKATKICHFHILFFLMIKLKSSNC